MVEPHRNHHASGRDVLGNGITESRTYSNDNLLTAINYSNTSLGDLTYTWDTNKNKTSESIGGVMNGYGFINAGTTYDDEDRLTGYQRTNGALSQSWNLTSVGDWNSVTTNGTAQSRTHGPTHELLTAGGQSVSTDVKGNITLLPSALSSLASTALGMSWDFDNKLKSVDVGNNSSTDVEYKYDALGRRVARVSSSGSYVYVQSDQQTIADYGVGDAPSSPLYRYVYASYIDEPVVRKGAGTGGTIHYYHRNQQYSITAVTTSAGSVAERYAYSAYGEPTICDASGSTHSSSSINNRYSYTGREWDATVGLYHFRARWMSPKSGRFLGRDPIGYRGSPYDLYEFCETEPLHLTDPSGRIPPLILIGVGIGAGVGLWTSPNIANAPGPSDPVYPNPGIVGSEPQNAVIGGVIGGSVGGVYVVGRYCCSAAILAGLGTKLDRLCDAIDNLSDGIDLLRMALESALDQMQYLEYGSDEWDNQRRNAERARSDLDRLNRERDSKWDDYLKSAEHNQQCGGGKRPRIPRIWPGRR